MALHGILLSTSSHDGHCVAEGNSIVDVTGSPGAGISIEAPHCQTDDNTIRDCEKDIYTNEAENASIGSDNCESISEHDILARGTAGGAGGNDLTIRGASALLDIEERCRSPRIEGFMGWSNGEHGNRATHGGVLRDATFRENEGYDGVTVRGDNWLIDGYKDFDNPRHSRPEASGNGGDNIRNNGTRLRMDGIIGGGPLGGVDIGSIDTSAISEGTEAVANGDTQTAGKTYRWFKGTWVDA